MRARAAVLAIVIGVLACSEIITGPDDGPSTRPRSMRVVPSTLSLAQAETASVIATLYDASGNETVPEPGFAVRYRSLDTLVATVDALTGLVTARTDGTVSVRAEYGAMTLGIPVTVLARPRLEIVSGDAQAAEQGDTLALRLVVRALDIANQPIADTAVTFTVLTGDGELQDVSARTDAFGTAQARWRLGLPLGTQSVEVTSAGLDAVTFTATATPGTRVARTAITHRTDTLHGVGDTTQMTASAFNVADALLPQAPISWTSSAPEVATVDATGLVTAVAEGNTDIRATSGVVSDSVRVAVVAPVATGKLSLGADIAHPSGLQVARTITLPAVVATTTTVTLRSLEPGNAVLALDDESNGVPSVEVAVPAGATSATYWLQGVEGTIGGNALLVAEAPGLEPDTIEVTMVQPAAQLSLVGPSAVPAVGGEDPVLLVSVGLNDGGTLVPMAVRAFGDAPSFDVTTQDQALAMVVFRATASTLGDDAGPTICAAFVLRPRFSATTLPDAEFGIPASLSVSRTGLAGTATLGLTSLSGYEIIGAPVTLTLTGSGALPKLSLGADLQHPAHLQQAYLVTVPVAVDDPVAVTITSSEVIGVLVGARQDDLGALTAEVEVEGGTNEAEYWLKGQAGSERAVRIIATAAGYEPDTMLVTMTRPEYMLRRTGNPTHPAVEGEDPVLVLTVGASEGDGFTPMAVSPGATPPSFTLQANQPAVGLVQFVGGTSVIGDDQGPATTVTFALAPGFNQTSGGAFSPANIRIARLGVNGLATVSVVVAPPDFDALFDSDGVTFTGAADVTVTRIEISPVSVSLLVGATQQFTASAFNAAGSLIASAPITWASPAPGVASVSSTGLVTAVAAGEVWITATSGDASQMAQVVVNAPLVCDYGRADITGAPPTVEGVFCPQQAPTLTEPNASGEVTAIWREVFDYGNGAYFEAMAVTYHPTTGVISSVTHTLNDPLRLISLSCSPLPFAPPPCTGASVNLVTRTVTFADLVLGQNPVPFTLNGSLSLPP